MIVLLHMLSIKSAWHLDSPPFPEILEEDSAVAIRLHPNLLDTPLSARQTRWEALSGLVHRLGLVAKIQRRSSVSSSTDGSRVFPWLLQCGHGRPCFPGKRRWPGTVQPLLHFPCSKATALAAIQGVTFQAVLPHWQNPGAGRRLCQPTRCSPAQLPPHSTRSLRGLTGAAWKVIPLLVKNFPTLRILRCYWDLQVVLRLF